MNFGRDLPEERLFEAALALAPEERDAFIRNAAGEDKSLLAAVHELLKGYAEAGGDDVDATLGSKQSARSKWAVSVEEPGTIIEHFRLVRCLGEGGMGTVWEAEQTEPVSRKVALKVIKLGMDTQEVVQRFERERQTLALMSHPNIAQVYEAGATALGRPYFAMELIEGEPITTYANTQSLNTSERLRLFRDVCAAIEHAHQKGIIHRDLKPSNILVSDGQIKVIDFGVAKATQGSESTATLFTQQSQMLGTPAYMSPEQATGDGQDIDTRTDVYSLGVVLYELLSGNLPFDPERLASTSMAEIQKILTEEDPPEPSRQVSAITAHAPLRRDLDWVVMKALAKERERRYSSAAAMAEDVQRYLAGDAVTAVPPTLGYRFSKFVRKNRLAVGAMAAVFLALAAGLVVSLIQTKRAMEARREVGFTVADLYARNGLSAEDPATASLWFAKAAVSGAADPYRLEMNRQRTAAWRQEAFTPVRALQTNIGQVATLSWNTSSPALILESAKRAQIWNLEADALWESSPSEIVQARWSPSGDKLAARTRTDVLVLEYPSGNPLATWGKEAAHASWSPDGRWIAVHGEQTFLWDWQVNERRPLATSVTGDSRVKFCEDGERLLVQWKNQTGIATLEHPDRFLFTPVETLVADELGRDRGLPSAFLGASGARFFNDTAEHLEIRDTSSGRLLNTFPRGDDPNNGHPVALSRDGRFIARFNQPIIDLAGSAAPPFPTHQDSYEAAAFTSDGSQFASGSVDLSVNLYAPDTGDEIGQIHVEHPPFQISYSPNGAFLAISEELGLTRIWRVRFPIVKKMIPVAGGQSLAALSTDGRQVALAGYTHYTNSLTQTRIYDLATNQSQLQIDLGNTLMDAAFRPNASEIAVALSTTPTRDEKTIGTGGVELWDTRSGTRLGQRYAMPSEPRSVRFHPSGRYLGVYCGNGEVLEIDLETEQVNRLFTSPVGIQPHGTLHSGRCGYSKDGRYFAVWGNKAHLWDRQQSKQITDVTEGDHVHDADFAGDTFVNSLYAPARQVEFRTLPNGSKPAPPLPYTDMVFLTHFDPTGERLLTAGRGKVAQVWHWQTHQALGPSLPHTHSLMAGTFIPTQRKVVATGCFDGTINFWDYTTGMMVRPPIHDPEGWILEMEVSADDRYMVASGHNGLHIIDLEAAFPTPELDPESALLLGEIDAGAEVHPSGGLLPLSKDRWLEKWSAFRSRHPEYPGHRLEN